MVSNATFNNNSVISRRSVLMMGETTRKPPTCRKSMTNFITYYIFFYANPCTNSYIYY